MTPAAARAWLQAAAESEMAEERFDPPSWAPFAAMHPAREVGCAYAAARTRVEHLHRLIALPDRTLSKLIADGWDPRHRT